MSFINSTRRRAMGAVAAAGALLAAGCAGQASDTVPAPVTDAMPPDPLKPLRRVAVGSCADQNKPQPIWDAILADKPDLFVFAGDNVYASQQPWRVEQLRAAYAKLAAQPGFARLRATVPHIETWDDHDYGLNDGGVEWANKQAAKDEFLQFWNVPPLDPRRQRGGVYREQLYGPDGQRVQIIMLDTRWARSPLKPTDQRGAAGKERYLPDDDPSKTMLGDAQWQWLAQRLRVPADLRLIVSSVQVLAEGHGYERWGNLPRERQRLIRLIGQTQAQGVLFLSGDRHVGGIYQDNGGPYPLHEMTSSGLTHAWADAREPGPNRLGDLVTSNHYGLIDVDWAAGSLQLSFKSTTGQLLRRHTLDLKSLKA